MATIQCPYCNRRIRLLANGRIAKHLPNNAKMNGSHEQPCVGSNTKNYFHSTIRNGVY